MDNQSSQANPKKLFVGNLPYSVTQDQLNELFSKHGDITEAVLLTDKFSGRSRGIGFVEFATEEAAQAAEKALNGFEIDGRAIVVNVARPRKPRQDFGGGGNRY